MDNVTEVEVITNRGKTPDQELINKTIRNHQEKGEYLDDVKVTSFFDDNNGLQEYTTTLIFREDSRQKDFSDDDVITEELGE